MKGIEELRSAIEEGRKRRTQDGGRGLVAAFVGAGGKTTAMFALARRAADEGMSVAVTTTTRIYDPRDEGGRPFDRVVIDDRLGQAAAPGAEGLGAPCLGQEGITVLAAGRDEAEGKLVGIEPSWCAVLAGVFDLVLVEADGARGLPVKAPAGHEPALPREADVVFGCIGLDCLGGPATTEVVHRLDRFLSITGAIPGSPISPDHLVRLVLSPEGLFKSVPAGALRVAVLNKADLVDDGLAERSRAGIEASGATCRLVLASLGPHSVPQ